MNTLRYTDSRRVRVLAYTIVNWHIEEIKLILMIDIDLSEQHLHVILIRYVLDHECCSIVFSVDYFADVEIEIGIGGRWASLPLSLMKLHWAESQALFSTRFTIRV